MLRSLAMGLFRIVLLSRVIGLRVVFVVVELLAGIVLLMIDLGALLRAESAAVGRAVVAHFVIDVGFAIFKMAGFAWSQLTGLDAIPDARLLVAFASVDAAHCSCRGPAMIFGCEVRAVGAGQVFV